jgi:hypothetical protein
MRKPIGYSNAATSPTPPVRDPTTPRATAEKEMFSPAARPLSPSPALARLSSSRPSSTTVSSISPAFLRSPITDISFWVVQDEASNYPKDRESISKKPFPTARVLPCRMSPAKKIA